MASLKKINLSFVSNFFRARTPLQLGAIVAGSAAVAAAGWYLFPFLKIEASVIKAWFVSFISGTKEERLLKYVQENAERGNAKSVIDTIDQWCWTTQWMMNVGNVKGLILDTEVEKAKPKVAVELGGYCGYSAVRIGRLLPEGSKFYSIEVSPVYAAIATQIIKFAGLQDKCEVLVGDSETVLNEFRDRTGQRHVDLFFIDHQKSLYLRDIKLIEKLDLLHSGSVIVADNVIMPGAPDYLAYIRANLKFKSAFYESNLEYSNAVDGVEVSVFQ